MKIKYDLDKNFFDIFNIVSGIMLVRKRLEKDPYCLVNTYTYMCGKLLKWTILEVLLMVLFVWINPVWLLSKMLVFLGTLLLGIVVICYIGFTVSYFDKKKIKHVGELQFSKTGIMDTNEDGIKIGLPWNKINALIVTDKVLCFTSDVSINYILEVDALEKVVEIINKYNKDLTIIDRSMGRLMKKITNEEEDTITKLVVPPFEEEEESKEEEKEN